MKPKRRFRSLLVAVGLLAAAGCGQKAASAPPPTTAATPAAAPPAASAPALLTTPPPWPAPTSGEGALVAQAQLPLLPKEALDEHIHAHLDVFYDGQPVTVPAYIGIVLQPVGISPLHTHDTTGVVHVESATPRPFSLGQFFTEWGVQMGGGCVAGQCPPGRPVAVFVNGAPVQGPAEGVEITAHAEIVVTVGTPPASIPSSYRFPSGY
ncbi:MAG: hypothetical protein NVS1B12_12510 [Acidimicrobiales bacterium]